MPNPVQGEVPLKLSDGREFILVADMEALVEAETAYGKPMRQMMADASQEFFGAMRAMLYGVLRAKHPTITLREAANMLANPDDAVAVADALGKAMEAAFPSSSEGKEGANPPGRTSGRNGAKRASNLTSSGA